MTIDYEDLFSVLNFLNSLISVNSFTYEIFGQAQEILSHLLTGEPLFSPRLIFKKGPRLKIFPS